jgi:hypothetical protein
MLLQADQFWARKLLAEQQLEYQKAIGILVQLRNWIYSKQEVTAQKNTCTTAIFIRFYNDKFAEDQCSRTSMVNNDFFSKVCLITDRSLILTHIRKTVSTEECDIDIRYITKSSCHIFSMYGTVSHYSPYFLNLCFCIINTCHQIANNVYKGRCTTSYIRAHAPHYIAICDLSRSTIQFHTIS